MKRTKTKDILGVFLMTIGNILMVLSVYDRYAHGDHRFGSMVIGFLMVLSVFVYANIAKE